MNNLLRQSPETEEFKRIKELCYKARDDWFGDMRFDLIPYWEAPSDFGDRESIRLAVFDKTKQVVVCTYIQPEILDSPVAGHTFRMMFNGMNFLGLTSFEFGQIRAVKDITNKLCDAAGISFALLTKSGE